ncbi:hypothetical protein [Rathayibacter tritici]|uniref:hypothetical protein n=1 Tax=Rathayibacter tritici TaxID=33888 RepID=UPI0011B0D737|nr:hypothetical protein [Rathayibacter tritici]
MNDTHESMSINRILHKPPYMRRHASLASIRATLSGSNMIPSERAARQSLAVTILVQEGHEAARRHIEAELAKIAGNDDPSLKYDREFAYKFLAYLDRTV